MNMAIGNDSRIADPFLTVYARAFGHLMLHIAG